MVFCFAARSPGLPAEQIPGSPGWCTVRQRECAGASLRAGDVAPLPGKCFLRAVTVVALAGGFHMAGAVCGSLLQLQLYCIIDVVLLVLQ